MMRTAIGVSFLVLATLGGVMACSGDSKDEATGKSGSSGSGGASNAGSGGANSQSGSSSQSGSNGTSGSNAALCAGKMNMCLDEQTVQGCDPETGMDFTVNCDDAPAGIINMGCSTTTDGTDACIIDFEDEDCLNGATVLAVCLMGGETGLYNAYLNCYNDTDGVARDLVTCLAPYLDLDAEEVDCDGLTICEMGAGGAPSDGGAGPGPGGGGEGGGG
jgi:hypothetical protein